MFIYFLHIAIVITIFTNLLWYVGIGKKKLAISLQNNVSNVYEMTKNKAYLKF